VDVAEIIREATAAEIIQLVGVSVSFLVALRQLLTLIRDWRGSPDLRAIREQMDRNNDLLRDSTDQVRRNNDRIFQLLERMIDRLNERG
jgi:hypothetical protein